MREIAVATLALLLASASAAGTTDRGFELALRTGGATVARGVQRRARLEKGRLVVKEDARPLRGRAAHFDRITLPALARV